MQLRGIHQEAVVDLVLKTLYMFGSLTPQMIFDRVALPPNLLTALLQHLQHQGFVIQRGSTATGTALYSLTEKGLERASEALRKDPYVGPVPVTLEEVAERIRDRRPRIREDWIGWLREHFDLPEETIRIWLEAFHAGEPVGISGPPGSGKTFVLESIRSFVEGETALPHTAWTEAGGLRFYSPSLHGPGERVPEDPRWVRFPTPLIVLPYEQVQKEWETRYDPDLRTWIPGLPIVAAGSILAVDDVPVGASLPPLQDPLLFRLGDRWARFPFRVGLIFAGTSLPELEAVLTLPPLEGEHLQKAVFHLASRLEMDPPSVPGGSWIPGDLLAYLRCVKATGDPAKCQGLQNRRKSHTI